MSQLDRPPTASEYLHDILQWNVFVTRRRMATLAAENLLAVLEERPRPNVINPF
jgi:hypothetical protein